MRRATHQRSNVNEHSLEESSHLVIEGDLDHASAPALFPVLERRLRDEGRLFLDLRRCAYVDSGGLSMLLDLAGNLPPHAWVGVIGPNRNIRRLFELAGLSEYAAFHVFADDAEAQAYVDGLPPRS